MFQLESLTEVRVTSVTNRVERHGEDEQPAVSLGLELTDANTLLDLIDPTIRDSLYKAVEGQDQLPGVEPATPVLRCNAFEKHTLTTSHEGWTLSVDDGIDQSTPMVFGSVKIDKFTVDAKQGGSVVLRFRAGTSDVDAEKLGKLAMHNGQSIWITLAAPKPGAQAIDGSTEAFEADHPDAGSLFAAGHGHDSDDADTEGGSTDSDLSPDLEARVQGAIAERAGNTGSTRSPAGSRTARGREKTKAALDAAKTAFAG